MAERKPATSSAPACTNAPQVIVGRDRDSPAISKGESALAPSMTTPPGMRRKRTASAISAMLALLPWIAVATACSSTIPPAARITRSIDLNYAQPRVMVWASQSQPEVRAAMQRAGILVESAREGRREFRLRFLDWV
jgi:hypothetical protein